MKKHTARAIAYIAARLESGKTAGHVYDYSTSSHTSMSGTVTPARVNVYDYDKSSYITGNGSGGSFNLYHYGNSAHVSLKYKSKGDFSGYDYDTSSHFTARVNGKNVSVYDYEHSSWTNFTV